MSDQQTHIMNIPIAPTLETNGDAVVQDARWPGNSQLCQEPQQKKRGRGRLVIRLRVDPDTKRVSLISTPFSYIFAADLSNSLRSSILEQVTPAFSSWRPRVQPGTFHRGMHCAFLVQIATPTC